MRDLMTIARAAKNAKSAVARLGANDKNRGLEAIAAALEANTAEILAANAVDIQNGRANGLNDGLIDRLTLTEARIAGLPKAAGRWRRCPIRSVSCYGRKPARTALKSVSSVCRWASSALFMRRVQTSRWTRRRCASRPVPPAFYGVARKPSTPRCA